MKAWIQVITLGTLWLFVAGDGTRNSTEVLRRISRFSNSMVRPLDWTGVPTSVSVSLYVLNFHLVSEERMEFSMDMYYRRMWNDPRLQYKDGPKSVIVSPDGATKWFWIPDLFFTNARNVDTHAILKPNVGARLKPNGDVLLSTKITAKIYCPMDLRHFPMDVQICELRVESYMHNKEDISLSWKEVKVSMSANPPAFQLQDVEYNTTDNMATDTGTYHQLFVRFRLRRLSSEYVVSTFLPSGAIVVLSCLVYWLPLAAIAERTYLSTFLLLSMCVILGLSRTAVPQVGYLKAIDVWTVSCFLFLFFNVLELLILYLVARSTGHASRLDQFALMKNNDTVKAEDEARSEAGVSFLSIRIVRRVDWILRVVYPCAFIFFNIIFWSSNTN